MRRTLEFWESKAPLTWFTGWVVVLAVFGGLICAIIAVSGDSWAEMCVSQHGTYSHTLNDAGEYDEKCLMP